MSVGAFVNSAYDWLEPAGVTTLRGINATKSIGRKLLSSAQRNRDATAAGALTATTTRLVLSAFLYVRGIISLSAFVLSRSSGMYK